MWLDGLRLLASFRSCGKGGSVWTKIDWVVVLLLVHGTCFQKLTYQLLLALVHATHLVRVFLFFLVKLSGNVQGCLFKRLRIDVTLLVLNEVPHCVDTLAEAGGVESVVVVA